MKDRSNNTSKYIKPYQVVENFKYVPDEFELDQMRGIKTKFFMTHKLILNKNVWAFPINAQNK